MVSPALLLGRGKSSFSTPRRWGEKRQGGAAVCRALPAPWSRSWFTPRGGQPRRAKQPAASQPLQSQPADLHTSTSQQAPAERCQMVHNEAAGPEIVKQGRISGGSSPASPGLGAKAAPSVWKRVLPVVPPQDPSLGTLQGGTNRQGKGMRWGRSALWLYSLLAGLCLATTGQKGAEAAPSIPTLPHCPLREAP